MEMEVENRRPANRRLPATPAERRAWLQEVVEGLNLKTRSISDQDRLLITMYLKNGNSLYQLAQLAGLTKAGLARRINRISKRLLEGTYLACLANSRAFGRQEIGLARRYFIGGLSVRQLASREGLSFYRTRKILTDIRDAVHPVKKAFDEDAARLAHEHFEKGVSIGRLADREGTSYYRMRTLLTAVQRTTAGNQLAVSVKTLKEKIRRASRLIEVRS